MSYEVFHRDIRTLVDFYVGVLGFQRSEAETSSGYVVVCRDEVRVGCSLHDEADSSPRRPPDGSEIVLRVDDIQAEYERVLSSGWPIADPLQNRPWGLKDFRVFDPSGAIPPGHEHDRRPLTPKVGVGAGAEWKIS